MLRETFTRLSVGCALLCIVGLILHGDELRTQSPKSEASGHGRKKALRSDDFFADHTVRVFEIELTAAAMNSLRRGMREYVSGRLREGGQVFTNVGIHLKGMGSFQTLAQKPSFAIKF